MAYENNQYGLSRIIPAAVAREIRQRSKFGCVICRGAICQYEHIDPEFKDATQHTAENICLMCGSCHGKVTGGQWSKEKVKDNYRHVQSDQTVKPPYSEFDISGGDWAIQLGPCTFNRPEAIFTVDGNHLLSFAPPETTGGPPRLSGVFCDGSGKTLLQIEDNIWTGNLADTWDIEVIGPKITIRKGRGKIALQIVVEPPSGLRVTHLDMRMGLAVVRLSSLLEIVRDTAVGQIVFGIDGDCTGSESCALIDTSVALPVYHGIEMRGGVGIKLCDSGIVWGPAMDWFTSGGLR